MPGLFGDVGVESIRNGLGLLIASSMICCASRCLSSSASASNVSDSAWIVQVQIYLCRSLEDDPTQSQISLDNLTSGIRIVEQRQDVLTGFLHILQVIALHPAFSHLKSFSISFSMTHLYSQNGHSSRFSKPAASISFRCLTR